jgi:uncharacterized membrane protein
LLLDRDVSMGAAIWTSIQAMVENPIPMTAWGLIVAGGLVIGSLPALLGLVIVMPVLVGQAALEITSPEWPTDPAARKGYQHLDPCCG